MLQLAQRSEWADIKQWIAEEQQRPQPGQPGDGAHIGDLTERRPERRQRWQRRKTVPIDQLAIQAVERVKAAQRSEGTEIPHAGFHQLQNAQRSQATQGLQAGELNAK